jgi:hypothetical protein
VSQARGPPRRVTGTALPLSFPVGVSINVSVAGEKVRVLVFLNIRTPWPQSTSELYRRSDRRLSAKLVPTFADRGVSRTSI